MSKLQHNNRLAKNQRGESIVEHNVSIDDNLLPNAAELERLKEIEPSIVSWIMERAEQEQNARIEWNKAQRTIISFDVKATHRFNFLALVFAFILYLVVIGTSIFCIAQGFNIAGSIFGSTAVITGIIFFLRASIRKRKDK